MIRDVIGSLDLDYSFKDVCYGVVYPVESKGQRLPASRDGKFYKDAIPDSKKKSIVYWEDYGSVLAESAPRSKRMRSRVRLIIWLNFSKLTISYRQAVSEVLSSIPKRKGNTVIKLVGQMDKDTDIFARYGYKDSKQYITAPYDVAAFEFDVYHYLPCRTFYADEL